ncbi:MAG: hypothetical protein H8K08_17935 [Nitrospira sp.]|nr:hypothetical protein [Nitrospira sp.]
MFSDKEPPVKVTFTLLENGLDFVLSAVECLSGTLSKRELKYAVLHLYSGAVLIVKERLLREDWTLLFANQERAEEKVFRSGSFHGPDLKQCLERLEDIDVEVSEQSILQLGLLADKRKRLEHLHFADSAEAVIALTADILSFVVDFVSRELDAASLDETSAKLLDAIRAKLTDFEAFETARWETISAEVESAQTVVCCPACLQEAWIIEDGIECKFCGHKNSSSQDAADEYIEHVMGEDRFVLEKDGGVWPVRKCPSCDWNSMVDLGYVESGHQYICFECGSQWEAEDLSDCSRCGEPKKDNDMSICEECFSETLRKDDT